MPTKLRRVPATTNNITTGIINYLRKDGHSASRVNTQGNFEPAHPPGRNSPVAKAMFVLIGSGYSVGHWKTSGARVGVADIVCCMHPSGSFLAIEIKNSATNDKMSKEQQEYSEEIRKSGGDYWIVTSYAQFLELYNRSIWSFPVI